MSLLSATLTAMTTAPTATAERTGARRGTFFVPALALAAAALVFSITALANTFEGMTAAMVAMLPTIAALVLGHLTLERETTGLPRTLTLAGLGAGYLALVLVAISLIT